MCLLLFQISRMSEDSVELAHVEVVNFFLINSISRT